ncbi:MAG: DNA-directed RNA polymerase subunit alpha [Candidatus Levybacteria bacterium]|nr:DNA-directed RNA polymerase subunit alpha [Candidatus Levybacteria bacterium]
MNNKLFFTVKEIVNADGFGEFAIEPLEPGYGYTIGNALRRVLYSSISGAAVTSVKIGSVKHKFSTVEGLKENVIDLLLNIKELNLKLADDKDSGTLTLSVKGAREITAADFEATDGVEVVNKDHYIGSLSGKGSKLEMELHVERGTGYVLAEEKKSTEVGSIQTDAIFSPIRRVTYSVEATRVGRQTNLDKLTIKIWTNGTVDPKESLEKAARMLASSFTQIFEPQVSESVDEESSLVGNLPTGVAKMTIDELDLPTRIYNSLRNGGIETVEQLLQTPRKDLISMRNMGGKSISVIEEKLQEKGISFAI